MTRARVAAFTPGPPSTRGGAAYAGALLPALARHLDVVAVAPGRFDWDGPTVAVNDRRPPDADVLLHFVADDPDHAFAYRAALRWGGMVVCHELQVPHLLGTLGPDEAHADLAAALGPDQAAAVRDRRAAGVATHAEAYLLVAVNRAVRAAEAVVVHSRFAEFAVGAEVPATPVFRVPTHGGAVPPGVPDRAEARRRLDLPAGAFLVGLFGYLGGHKRVDVALRAVADARAASRGRHLDVRPVVVGTAVATDLHAALAAAGLADVAVVRPAPDDDGFFAHLAAVDVLVNLRHPTLGETSATTAQAMRLGTPVITTDHAQFAEEVAAVRVAPGGDEVAGVARALLTLAGCGRCRSRLAEAGRRRARAQDVERAALAYAGAVEATLARRAARGAGAGPPGSGRPGGRPHQGTGPPGGPLGHRAGLGEPPRQA
ncbi:MAG: glycosyltransferase [Acidimicrobiales bacterium]